MLTGLAHDVLAHLAGLDDSFAPADDLDLARAVLDRTDFAIVADDLGCEPQVARARWQALRDFSPILTDRGHLSIDGQAALMLALKYRACHAAG
ncbi:MAG: hypothetical protein Q4G36_08315 [Paracoccus sp. (in: a-proteobacteria)]|nr:hypothetical protein [Paracoccus sp. (in: a-proteobacteria)]